MNRTCQLCGTDAVEDERHVLLQCDATTLLRQKWGISAEVLLEQVGEMDFDDLKLDEVMDESVISKTAAGTLQGLVMGTVWGAVVASWKDVPKVERNVAWPGMKRTLLMMGNYGATFAAVGGIFALTDKVSQKLRNKQDFWNGTIGAFVSGAIVIGLRGRSIKYGIQAGTAFGACVAFMDSTGQTIRVDNGTEYFPYNIITDESE